MERADTIYQFRALPFGLSPAPWVFTKVMREIKMLVHVMGINLCQYLDDWLIYSPSHDQCLRDTVQVLNLCHTMGLLIQDKNSELIPKQKFLFLGYQFGLVSFQVTPTLDQYHKIKALICAFLLSQEGFAHTWQILLGLGLGCTPTKSNIQQQVSGTEWPLHPSVFRALTREWGIPFFDLFATRWNHKLSLFMSPVPDPSAMAIDDLSTSWKALWAYAYPPPALLPRVLEKAQQEQCELILIAPHWPPAIWFPLLLRMLVQSPLRIPNILRLLSQP